MTEGAVSRLSKRQRECLELVLEHLQTGEIAQRLGIAEETAKNHIEAAKAKLGVSSRWQAARMLAAASPSRTSPTKGISEPSAVDVQDASSDRDTNDALIFVAETIRPFGAEQSAIVPGDTFVGGTGYDLKIWQKLALIVAMTFGLALGFGGLLAGVEALSSIFRA